MKRFLAFGMLFVFTAVTRLWGVGRVPPGLWFDEAWVSVRALASDWPVYFSANFGGMHPAIVYLTRFLQPLLAHDPLTIRYAVALVSVVTMCGSVVVYNALAQRSRGAESQRAWFYPFLAAFVLSILYPFFHFSRLGFESILPAPLALLAFGLLAGYLNDGARRWRWLLALGVVCGLSLYVFDTGRFVPLAIALAFWWGWLVAEPRAKFWPTAVRFGLIVLLAVLVSAPLLRYFGQNWAQLTARAAVTTYNTLGPGAEFVPLAILQNVGRTFGGLFLSGWGDGIARHNLPGRPIFDPFLGALFVVGLLILGRRPRQPATVLLLSWLGVGLLPVVLTDGAPTYTRLFVAVPALVGITAVGGVWLVARPWPRQWVGYGLLLGGLAFSTAVTLYDYFVLWPQTPQLYDDFQVGQWEAGQLAWQQAAQAKHTVYFVPDKINLDNPTLALLLNDTAVRPHPPAPCLLLPTDPAQTVTYVVDRRSDKEMVGWLRTVWPETEEAGRVRHEPTGDTIYTAVSVPAKDIPISPNTNAQFGEGLALRGYTLDPTPNGVTLTLLWAGLAPMPEAYTLFVHLYPAEAGKDVAPVAQLDAPPCWPTDRWRVGEYLIEQKSLPWPEALPPGTYDVALGWYAYPSFTRLPLMAGEEARVWPNNRLWLGQVELSGEPSS